MACLTGEYTLCMIKVIYRHDRSRSLSVVHEMSVLKEEEAWATDVNISVTGGRSRFTRCVITRRPRDPAN